MTTTTATIVGTPEAARLAGVTYRVADYWCRLGAITPTGPARGTGTYREWNAQDVRMLAAIGRVRADLAELGLDMSVDLVDQLWRALNEHAHVVITHRTVSISTGLEVVA